VRVSKTKRLGAAAAAAADEEDEDEDEEEEEEEEGGGNDGEEGGGGGGRAGGGAAAPARRRGAAGDDAIGEVEVGAARLAKGRRGGIDLNRPPAARLVAERCCIFVEVGEGRVALGGGPREPRRRVPHGNARGASPVGGL